jgi:CHASE1-domain containing sensor protein
VKVAAPSTDSCTAIAARYEALRAAAFGDGLPPEARSGLTLFLRRGMWGWARALTLAPRPSQEQASPSPAGLPFTHDGRSCVVRLLASIAMGSNDDRRSP